MTFNSLSSLARALNRAQVGRKAIDQTGGRMETGTRRVRAPAKINERQEGEEGRTMFGHYDMWVSVQTMHPN